MIGGIVDAVSAAKIVKASGIRTFSAPSSSGQSGISGAKKADGSAAAKELITPDRSGDGGCAYCKFALVSLLAKRRRSGVDTQAIAKTPSRFSLATTRRQIRRRLPICSAESVTTSPSSRLLDRILLAGETAAQTLVRLSRRLSPPMTG